VMPGGYKDEHITHYTREKLGEILPRYGFAIEEAAYIAGSDLILRCRATDSSAEVNESGARGEVARASSAA
ncbi:MAG TPA: hypothetical protein VEU51_03735, partial [Candidatus Acidoferrales bacterium]|nr:hypothetical protein [Candidatus Acidoferrales bacterium]